MASKNFYFVQQKLLFGLTVFSEKRNMDRDKKNKFDFETTLWLYNDGVGRKYIPYREATPPIGNTFSPN